MVPPADKNDWISAVNAETTFTVSCLSTLYHNIPVIQEGGGIFFLCSEAAGKVSER